MARYSRSIGPLAVALIMTNVLIAQDGEIEKHPEYFESALKSLDPEASVNSIREIMQIRNRLGGGTGVESVLEGFNLGGSLNLEKAKLDEPFDLGEFQIRSGVLFGSMIDDCSVDRTASKFGQAEQSKIVSKTAYRNLARKMDQLAADLEDFERFEAADTVRQEAAKLRRTARSPVNDAKQRMR